MTREMQRTLFIIKPDAQPARRTVMAQLLDRYDVFHLTQTTEPLGPFIWERHYAEHQGKPFFLDLIDFMISGPVTVADVRGLNVIPGLRALLGPTKVADAPAGTLRGDWASLSTGAGPSTLFHASDSLESAQTEIHLWETVLGWRVA